MTTTIDHGTTSPVLARHPWLAWCTPEQRDHALNGLQSAWTEIYRSEFAFIGVSEFMAAMQDPELAGLYVPPPANPERYLDQMRRTYHRDFVVPNGMAVEAYARQVQLREAVSPAVTEEYLDAITRRTSVEEEMLALNSRYHFVQNVGGKVRIVWWEKVQGNVVLQMQSVSEFRNAHMNRRIVESNFNPRNGEWEYCAQPSVALWLRAEQRPTKARLVFRPEQPVAEDELNLWHGFAYVPRDGLDKIDRYLTFLHDVICGGNSELTQYVWAWMANAVQNPHRPGETALVLQSGQGTGKGFFARSFGKLFGRHFLQSANAKHILGDFNAHLRYCVLLYADEAFFAGDRRQANGLKALVTEPTLMIEGKGVDSEPSANCIHLIVSSNEQHVVRLDEDDRRFCVLRVADKWKNRRDLFALVDADLEDGGYEQLLAALKAVDLTDWSPQPVPNTAARDEQKLLTNEDTWDAALSREIDKLVLGKLRGEGFWDLDPHEGETWESETYLSRLDALVAAQGVRVHTDTLLAILGIPVKDQDHLRRERLAGVMKRLGWQHKENVRIFGEQGKGYVRAASNGRADIGVKADNDVTVAERYGPTVTS